MVHIKKLNEMAVNAQRSVSYGELAELENMFNDQVEKRHIVFGDTEESTEALFDFIQQYIEGNDNPQVNVGYRESRRANAHGRALNEMARTRKTQYFWNIEEMRKVFGDWENYRTVEDSANMDGATDFYSPEDAYADGLENLRDYTDGDYSLSVYYFHNNGAGEYVSGYYAEIHNGKLTER